MITVTISLWAIGFIILLLGLVINTIFANFSWSMEYFFMSVVAWISVPVYIAIWGWMR